MSTFKRKYIPWNVSVNGSSPALARFAKALFLTDSTLTSSFLLRPEYGLKNGITAFGRIFVPNGREEEFEEVSGLKLEPIGRISAPSVNDEGIPEYMRIDFQLVLEKKRRELDVLQKDIYEIEKILEVGE